MAYIVFDLEWNQCPYGKEWENPRLPFEIVEIGAVKLNEQKEPIDSFDALIRPYVYKKLHYQTKKVIGIREEELRDGIPFPEAAESFFKWCGEEAVFCTWGTLDLTELQRNLLFYGMEELLKGPVIYCDVQKLFAITFETRKIRRSLKTAVEMAGLPEDMAFHTAKDDAAYTAELFRKIPDETIRTDFSIDCFSVPRTRKEEVYLVYPGYHKFISKSFGTKEAVMEDRTVNAIYCTECGRKTKRALRYFSDGGGRNRIGCGICPEHGYIKSKVRVRETHDGRYYAIRTTKQISEEDLEKLKMRAAALRVKRRAKRS